MQKWELRKIDSKIYTNYWYGLFKQKKYNKQILKTLEDYELLDLNLLIGLEFEFYVKDKIKFFRELRKIIPHTQQVLVNTTIAINGNLETWVVSSDDSLVSQKEGYEGIELISPILDYKLGIYYIKSILKLLDSDNTLADNTTGLHIHISEPNNKKDLTPKEIILLAQEYNLFSWKERDHSQNIYSEIFEYKEKYWIDIYYKVIKRCYGLNLFYLNKDNHIEYKSIGGKNYFKKEEQIIENFLNLVKIFDHIKNKKVLKKIEKELTKSKKKDIILPRELSLSKFKERLKSTNTIL